MLERFFSKEEIRRITRSIINLPTLPTVVAKMLEMLDNPKTSAAQLSRLISGDQVLTAKVLRLANSAFYAFPQPISTVNLAVVVLGFDVVKNLVIGISVIESFSKEADGYFDVMRFWEHSIGCGVAARMLARMYGYQVSGEAFTAGLLHDIGKLVMREHLKVEFLEVLGKVQQGKTFLEAEEELLGVTHAEIGNWLAERWNFPVVLQEAILCHHRPGEARKEPMLAAIVHFADVICKHAEVGFSGDHVKPPLDEAVYDVLSPKLTEEGEVDMGFYVSKLRDEMERAEVFMSTILGKELEPSRGGPLGGDRFPEAGVAQDSGKVG
ncbi:MAG: HD family phosphohydrolase [Candidatus Latescibacterota bacterium]|nr:MAG: HD family phosphohydrolase [Candidatus Latescibacterota bacterium]